MNRIMGAALAGAISLVLSGCGGDGGSSSAPTTISANPDSAVIDWNASSTIDVLANDTASQGALTVSALTAPAHGQAAISGSAVQYTPAAGYFGPDSFDYTVTAADGSTAHATVNIAVNAKIALSGTVSDGPLANARITAAVGSQTFTATADANGKYSVSITPAAPDDLIVLTAQGNGAQSTIKLRSIVGDAQAVAALAKTDGSLGPDQLASTNVSHVSTALAALVEEANGAQTPATLAQFAALAAGVSMDQLMVASAAISTVADQGAALPSGVADTAALVDHPHTSQTFADCVAARLADSTLLSAEAKLTLASVPAGSAALVGGSPRTLAYFVGYRKAGFLLLLVTYAPDGTAQVTLPGGTTAATWAQSNGIVTLTLAQPIVTTTSIVSPNTGQLESALDTTTGYQVSHVAGPLAGGVALVQLQGSFTIQEGSDKGAVVPFGTTAALYGVADMATIPALAAADFASGTLWGGLVVGHGSNDVALEDILAIGGAGSASWQRIGGQATWSVADGVLKVVSGGVEVDYRRLVAAGADGVEQWLAQTLQAGKVVNSDVQMIAKVTAGLKFSDDASLYRQWESGIGEGTFFDLYAGGTGARIDGPPDTVPTVTKPLSWTLGSDGTVTVAQLSNGTPTSQREWTLVGKAAGGVIVMEHLAQSGTDYWRLNLYGDAGAAAP